MKTALELIAEERTRQITEEGWAPSHDDSHSRGELAGAAACYALNACGFIKPHLAEAYRTNVTHTVRLWPWGISWWKPTNPIRDMVKAGALIAAEIDRLQRLETKP